MNSPTGSGTGDDPTPPVADDDFPEFAEPPRQKPSPQDLEARAPGSDESGTESDAQSRVDDLLARLRRERGEDDG